MEQQSQHQMRRGLIKAFLQFKDINKKEGEAQKQQSIALQKQIENITFEVLIKQFEQLQQSDCHNIKFYEKIFCRYNPHKKAQFLCCNQYCDNHAIMCTEQTCKCALDHRKCAFTSIESFRDQIFNKTQQSIPKQIELYFQVKSVIYEHMVNRISQERQALMDWQKDIHDDSALFLNGFNVDQVIVCHTPKVRYQKINQNHQKCCVPLQLRKNQIKEDKEESIKAICKNIHKKYSSMIEYFDQKVDQLYYHKKYANLSSAELLFIDFVKDVNAFIQNSVHKELNLDESLKKIKIVTGRAIYVAMKYNKKQFKNVDLEKFSINRLRRIWKGYSEKIFRLFVEGKAINELFCQIGKLRDLKAHSVQELRSSIDKIIQSISQGQEHLFSKSVFSKKLALKNLQEEQLCNKLKRYEGMEVNEVYFSNNRQRRVFDSIKIIKDLENLRNVRKLEIKWCCGMPGQFAVQILNKMPHLTYLALLLFTQYSLNDFVEKLCQFKQLKSFYVKYYTHPEYYRSYCQDQHFSNMKTWRKSIFPRQKQVQLSKLPKLQNISIAQTEEKKIEQVIKNMKKLRHISLGKPHQKGNKLNGAFMKELSNHNSLRTLSLANIEGDSKQVSSIISKNPHLSTIIVRSINNDNKIVDDVTIECMVNLIQLQTLCICNNAAITGEHLSKLDSIKMLQIYNCQKISKKLMKQALAKMRKLQYLQLRLNEWVDDEVIMSIQSCKQLTCLDLQRTDFQGKIVNYLAGLNRLSILKCGFSNIQVDDLIKLTKHIPSINRLSIAYLNVNDNGLLEIAANCQELTHLNLGYSKISVETLLKIKNLKVVKINYDWDSLKKLREAGIKLYQYKA